MLGRKHKRPEDLLPKTVNEAVEFLIANLKPEDRTAIASTPREVLGSEFALWGLAIRNGLGLWHADSALRLSLPEEFHWPDAATDYLMQKVWERLQPEKPSS